MKRDTYDPKKHKHFSIKVTDFDDSYSQYDVFGHDSLKSENAVYQSCVRFPIDNVLMVLHAGGIALFGSFKSCEIFVQTEPPTEDA